MLAEPRIREALLTLYAFHYELAKIPEFTSEPMMGAIRYQWWREAIDEIYLGKPVRRHEVTTPLAQIVKAFNIPRFHIDQLINGRERDIDPRPFEDIDEARQYCSQTSGVLAHIAAYICDPDKADIGQELGQVWGLTGLLRGYGFYEDTMLKNLSKEAFLSEARQAYRKAQGNIKTLPVLIVPAFAYIALVPGFLRRHSLATPRSYGGLSKRLRLLITAMTGKLPK